MGARRWLIGALAAPALTACGAPPPTLARLRAGAARICTAADRQTDEIAAPSSSSETATFLRRGLAVLQPELSQLRGLQAPSSAAPLYQAALTAFAQETRAIRSTIGSLEDGSDPARAVRALQRRLTPLEREQNGAWQALGVSACLAG